MQLLEAVSDDTIISFPDKNSILISDNISSLFKEDYDRFLNKELKWKYKLAVAEHENESYDQSLKGRFINLSIKKQMYLLLGTTSIGAGSGLITIYNNSPIIGSGITTLSLAAGFILSCAVPRIFYEAAAIKEKNERSIEIAKRKLRTIKDIHDIVEAGACFIHAYKNFKEDPITLSLKNLFSLFEKIKSTYLEKVEENKSLDQKFSDLNIFILNPLGNFILMDKTAHLCQGFQEAWSFLRTFLLSDQQLKGKKLPESWEAFNNNFPEQAIDSRLQVRIDELRKIEIEEHLTAIFKKALNG